MSQLTQAQIEELQQALLRKRHELQEDLQRLQNDLADQNQSSPAGHTLSNVPTSADTGSETYSRGLTADLIKRASHLLDEVDAALTRIADGTYGICEATGERIELKRLRAKPWARVKLDEAR